MKIVKIKTWEQMEEEYDTDVFGDIITEFFFTKGMEKDMPENRIIEVDDDNHWLGWYIDEDMIEKVIKEEK